MAFNSLRPGVCPTNDISIEFEIRPKFAVLWFKVHSTNHNESLHTPRQYNCRGVCKISLWSVELILHKRTSKFDRFFNAIEIPLVGRAPGQNGGNVADDIWKYKYILIQI